MNNRMKLRVGVSVATPLLIGALGGCASEEVSLAMTDQSIAQQMSVDSQYMMTTFASKTGTGITAQVNLADPAQHRFVMTRLAAAGKTAENSPELFGRIQKQKDRMVALSPKGGATTSATSVGAITNATIAPWCAGVLMLGNEVRSGAAMTFPGTHANVSCKGGAVYVYTDITTYNANRAGTENFVVASTAGEDYSGGTAFDAVQINPALPAVVGRVNKTDSLLIAYDALGNEQITYTAVASNVVPTPGSLLLQHPVRHAQVANGGDIQMCQLRGTEAECDYRVGNLSAAGAFAQFQQPINRIATVRTVNPWVPDTTQTFAFPAGVFDPSHVYLPTVGVLDVGATEVDNCAIKTILSAQFHLFKTVTGGVCDTVANFKASVINTANPRKATFNTVSDFTNNGGTSIPPGVDCKLSQIVNERVKPSMVITASAHCGLFKPDGSPQLETRVITLSPEGSSPIPNFVKFVNSCFAEGTAIRQAGGKTVAIETVKVGDKVIANDKGTVLTVTGVSKGIEDEPLVVIRDSKGHSLQLTHKHPVVKASGEVVFAQSLKQNDKVMMDRGIATVTSVSRLAYTGQVYNLKLGTAEEQAKVGKNGTTLYAGGFLVGDSAMQEEHSAAKTPVASLTEGWKRDYQNASANNPPMKRILR